MPEFEQYLAVKSAKLSRPKRPRWVVINQETGEIVDDARGYGYRSEVKACKAFTYKQKYLNPTLRFKTRQAQRWLLSHSDFDQKMMEVYLTITDQGEWQGHQVFDALTVSALLTEEKYDSKLLSFSPKTLLLAWQSSL